MKFYQFDCDNLFKIQAQVKPSHCASMLKNFMGMHVLNHAWYKANSIFPHSKSVLHVPSLYTICICQLCLTKTGKPKGDIY